MLRFGVGVLNLRSHVVMNEAHATNAVKLLRSLRRLRRLCVRRKVSMLTV